MKANEFKKYWDKKSQKRRKSWEGKLKRRIANHTPIEEIRKDVFKPFCQSAAAAEQFKASHRNPII